MPKSRSKKYILAVSGGIDSMTLLDLFSGENSVVAHFNHGTRPSADDDEDFVRETAKKYHLEFVSEKKILGPHASEAVARAARYDFLKRTAKAHSDKLGTPVKILTAHHASDVRESIVINLLRGTGWRGLQPMNPKSLNTSETPDILRPLISWEKSDIIKYAAEKHLTFRLDPTNSEDYYLRNRVRSALSALSKETKLELTALWGKQCSLSEEIDHLLESLLPSDNTYRRAWFMNLKDESVALELLRTALLKSQITVTRPQLKNFLLAIKTYPPEKSFNLPGDKLITLHKTYFKL